jgi:hypothetical protein
MSTTLQIANLGALEANLYTAKKAGEFVDRIIADLEELKTAGTSITYYEAIAYLDKKFEVLDPKIQAAFVLIDSSNLLSTKIELPLCSYDIDLLIRHLSKQRAIITIYGG